MDSRCLLLNKCMIDGGTLGTKGHVQVVIPNLTESYASSRDMENKSIPLCTIKSYPNTLEHCIEWALEQFKLKFNEVNVSESVDSSKSEDDNEESDLNESVHSSNDTTENQIELKLTKEKDLLVIALSLFNDYFTLAIEKLLKTFPPNHKTKEGLLFWSPPKKCPQVIQFDKNDNLHVHFVESTMKLYSEMYNVPIFSDIKKLINEFTDEICDCNWKIVNEPVKLLEFDKDSYHSDFIYTVSNLRARNYSIKENSKHFITGIAGRIIPAIATTTAIVSGLIVLEIIKYLNSMICEVNKEDYFKNSFLDLNLPLLASIDPISPIVNKYNIDNKEINFNIWTKIYFDDVQLSILIKEIESYFKSEVSMISVDNRIVYWDMVKKYDDYKLKKLSEIIDCVNGQKYINLTVIFDDEIERENIVIKL
ncbi:UBA1Y [Hepatospora eriocheir]|uniref:UBA1Y n=1 Tax=Hepatospora eriocheir TaxID=1081669 RepID=A0A1X0QJY8_9MICR|nr:UBA1Y [Hepatospora eriocheir]